MVGVGVAMVSAPGCVMSLSQRQNQQRVSSAYGLAGDLAGEDWDRDFETCSASRVAAMGQR